MVDMRWESGWDRWMIEIDKDGRKNEEEEKSRTMGGNLIAEQPKAHH